MNGLVIVGAGGFARETAQAVADTGEFKLLGHLDDNPALHGTDMDGVPVLGGCDLVHELPEARVVICVGNPGDYAARARLVRRLALPADRYATVIHPTASVSRTSTVGPGSVLLAHCVLTAAVRVGAQVAVMPQVVLTHDDVVEDYATLASGVRLGGGVRLERGAYVGAGALVREGRTVGAWSLTGMGSTVLGDIPPGEVWAGSPARRLRAAPAPALDELSTQQPGGTSRMTHIPLVDLKAAHAEVADDVRAGFERVLANTAFVGGDEVAAFEREYADFGRVAHCVGVANGTDALELALRASGVGVGDEVVIPANTFIATAGAVARIGARPVLADCLPDTYLLDPRAALDAVGPATRAVVPVHLYGQLADVAALTAQLPERVRVVEDAAQCQGATRDGRTPGSGSIAATSFYPGKNLGAYGDAGAVLTDDRELADLVRAIANHGGVAKYRHDVPGFNSRLDGLQAVVLRAKLARLADGNAARRTAAARYDELLAELAAAGRVVLPTTAPGSLHVWHLYVVQVAGADRDDVVGKLNAEGIGAGVHYPAPVHLTEAYRGLGYGRGDFPNAERAADRILSLPLYPQITPDQQRRVVDVFTDALGR